MKLWEKYLDMTKKDLAILNEYRKMRKILQDYGTEEWQLPKGINIPTEAYFIRSQIVEKLTSLRGMLEKLGLTNTEEEQSDFTTYIMTKFSEIDKEIPLQKGNEPDNISGEKIWQSRVKQSKVQR